ncbi:MAG: cation:proton antiporter [Kiritimatiellae bacterium]|jgi:Kef-type K+ transport system membrane component KefB/predicted transcriptional regulator|nr:cation:proton antiporter [Kiritimatiellia bacterium]
MENTVFSHGLLFILGIGIFLGLIGAWFFQKIKFPQVVGYIVMGLLLGDTGFKLITLNDVELLQPFNVFALGIIGFLVGGELKLSSFKKYGKQFSAILFGEGLGAFFIVGTLVTLILFVIFHNFATALAGGIVFGAIASATDPASTVDVLWEYRARGVLTTSITAIVALDDALAMALYGLGTSVAQILSSSDVSIGAQCSRVGIGLLGAIVVGVLFAIILNFVLRWIYDKEKTLGIALGVILLMIALAGSLKMDVILASMTLGFAVSNISPKRSEKLFSLMRGFSTPIYVLFFVLVGARLSLGEMPAWLWIVVGVYVVGRSVGKFFGAMFGARVSKAPVVVQKYLGLGLFAQGGVAVGLSIMAGHHLQGVYLDKLPLGDAIIFGVTATTLIVQLIGPATVKLAIKLAGEMHKNITAEDVIASWKVVDVVDSQVVSIPESTPLHEAIKVFSEHRHLVFPVTNSENQFIGILSIKGLKDVLMDQASWQWLLVSDVVEPTKSISYPSENLKPVIRKMESLNLEELPVLRSKSDKMPIGVITLNDIRTKVAEELLRLEADLDVDDGAEVTVKV